MKLGLGLPNALPHGLDRQLLLDWARLGDEAGFHTLATLDHPDYDMWDPLACLAAVATVTTRARLATTILQLPIRDATMVAKQAAVIDRLSGGRFVLGVGLGGRAEDYAVYGVSMAHRVGRFRAQLGRIREVWAEAHASTTRDFGPVGPAPVQLPGPAILIGAVPTNEAGVRRAVKLGDGFLIGAAPEPEAIGPVVERVRAWAAEYGKSQFTIGRIAYVAVGGRNELDEAVRQTARYYPKGTARPPEELVKHGSAAAIAEWVGRHEPLGLDELVLFPQVPSLAQVEALATHVLPAFG